MILDVYIRPVHVSVQKHLHCTRCTATFLTELKKNYVTVSANFFLYEATLC